MSFDNDTRNLLARTVSSARALLTADVQNQLQANYGLYPDGRRLSIARTPNEQQAAAELADLWDHFAANEPANPQSPISNLQTAYQRLTREIGFTLLNRLAALRLCEERGIVIECVGKGMQSAGFQLYDRLANGALGNRYQTYRAFLEGLFDELALDLGALFARDLPQSHIFPGETTLARRQVWQSDETIGWIYQYYNDPDEGDLAALSFSFNGYEAAERLGGYGDLLEWASERIQRFQQGGSLPADPLDLWLLLFAMQRSWRIITGSGPAPRDFLDLWRNIYLAWREAVGGEQ